MTFAVTSTTLTATADNAGEPFLITVSTNSASGTINGSGSSTGTATLASSGGNDWSSAPNWSADAVPVATNNVYLENSAVPIWFGLAQSAVTLASLNFATTFTAPVGLTETNSDASPYLEYRLQYLTIGATLVNIGNGEQGGAGSPEIKLDNGSVQTTLTCNLTGSQLEPDVEPLQWKGTNSSNVINLNRGSMAIAGYAGDVATVATLNVGYMTSQGSDSNCRVGAGVTLTTLNMSGGAVDMSCGCTTIVATAGSLVLRGTGAYTTITIGNGDLVYLSSGTIGTLVVLAGGVADFSQSLVGVTITNCTLHAGATLLDPFGRVTFSNAILLANCYLSDVVLNLGQNRHFLPS